MPRPRDFLALGQLPVGPHGAITDVAGVRVGHVSLTSGDLRTGVTAVLPHGRNLYREKVTAGCAVLNGYGKSIGLLQLEELGTIETPVLITSTLNVPRVADGLISYMLTQDDSIGITETVNPVVLECFDGYLSDARARAAGEREVSETVRSASGGRVAEGCVGAGVGMRCQGFKSGVGTSSRLAGESGHMVGVLAVPNFGFPGDLVIAGVPVGKELATAGQPSERDRASSSSPPMRRWQRSTSGGWRGDVFSAWRGPAPSAGIPAGIWPLPSRHILGKSNRSAQR